MKIMSLKRSILTTVLLGTIAVLSSTVMVRAGTFSFSMNSIDGNTMLDGTQFQLSTLMFAPGQVEFTISNQFGFFEAFIGQIYWDDDANVLLSLDPINADPGINFSEGATPPDLPGGNNIGFFADFGVGAESPAPTNGINPGEEASFVFILVGGMTFADVNTALGNGDLRVGIHVQGIHSDYLIPDEFGEYNEDSDSFVTVPEPSTLILLLSSAGFLAGAAGFWRKLK